MCFGGSSGPNFNKQAYDDEQANIAKKKELERLMIPSRAVDKKFTTAMNARASQARNRGGLGATMLSGGTPGAPGAGPIVSKKTLLGR